MKHRGDPVQSVAVSLHWSPPHRDFGIHRGDRSGRPVPRLVRCAAGIHVGMGRSGLGPCPCPRNHVVRPLPERLRHDGSPRVDISGDGDLCGGRAHVPPGTYFGQGNGVADISGIACRMQRAKL